MLQAGTKHKKFTHNRMKACIDRNDQEDKENIFHFEDFRNKKLSVQLPSRCLDSVDNHQKSIFNEQISVTLNTNSRTHAYDRDVVNLDVKTLSHLLNRQHSSSVPLSQLLAASDLKSVEVKLLVDRMVNYLKSQQSFQSSISEQRQQNLSSQHQLSSTLLKPEIERQIEVLSKNLEHLVQQRQHYQSIKSISSERKVSMLNSLREMYQSQMRELQELQ